jgi:hypothetical protein
MTTPSPFLNQVRALRRDIEVRAVRRDAGVAAKIIK